MYVVFRCYSCGRFLYTKKENKTRKCPCGKKIKLKKAKKLGETEDRKKAAEAVRELQEKEFGEPRFERYKNE